MPLRRLPVDQAAAAPTARLAGPGRWRPRPRAAPTRNPACRNASRRQLDRRVIAGSADRRRAPRSSGRRRSGRPLTITPGLRVPRPCRPPGTRRRTSARPRPGTRPRRRWSAAGESGCVAASPGGSWPAIPASAAVPRVVPGASRPLTDSSSARDDAVAVAESTMATRSPTQSAAWRREQRIVGAAQQQRVDAGGGRQREDELAVRVALAQERRDGPPDRLAPRRDRSAARPPPAARGWAWRARRPRRPGSRP